MDLRNPKMEERDLKPDIRLLGLMHTHTVELTGGEDKQTLLTVSSQSHQVEPLQEDFKPDLKPLLFTYSCKDEQDVGDHKWLQTDDKKESMSVPDDDSDHMETDALNQEVKPHVYLCKEEPGCVDDKSWHKTDSSECLCRPAPNDNIVDSDNDDLILDIKPTISTNVCENDPQLLQDVKKEEDCSPKASSLNRGRLNTDMKIVTWDLCGPPLQEELNPKHTVYSPYRCDDGRKSVVAISTLKRHKKVHTLGKHVCGICAASFTGAFNLKQHKRIHTDERPKSPYRCDVCTASFTQTSGLKQHMRIHTGERPYSCYVCTASYRYASNLKRHMSIHTGEKPYSCDVCAASFTCASSLKRHMTTHTGERPYICDVCAASFKVASSLKQHMRIHSGMSGERPYSCDVCAARFTLESDLKRHKRSHTHDKPYSCDVCAASFPCASNLKQHKRIYTHDRPYTCDVCEALFTDASNLKQHLRIHTCKRPYSCDVCAALFTLESDLKQHKRIHTCQKPYSCDVCAASFNSASSLKQHNGRNHTNACNEGPYVCDVCAIMCKHAKILKQHMRIHTGEKPHNSHM